MLIHHVFNNLPFTSFTRGRLVMRAFGQCQVGWVHWVKNGLLGWISNILMNNGPT